MRARGTQDNPPTGRFEALQVAPTSEEEFARAGMDVRTELLRDPARSIVATNQSPDIGFAASVNPYRGCEHGCVYCLTPDTPVLHADKVWRPIGETRVGDRLLGFEEHVERGQARTLLTAEVEDQWWSRRPTLRLTTRNSQVLTTAEHRWLRAGEGGWCQTVDLRPGMRVAAAPSLVPETVVSVEPAGVRLVVDIQTSTRTFFAAGLASHNCYARPGHEFLGMSAGLDFETKILVKEAAPELLRKKLSTRSWKPQVIAFSGVTDCYQPAERHLGITRRCLEVLLDFRNPAALITKSWLVSRDAELLAELARFDAASVLVSVTTLDADLQRKMEPRASKPSRRLAAIEKLAEHDVPVGVMIGPIIPGLTEHELPNILRAAADAGAGHASRVLLRLPHGVGPLFETWLREAVPDRCDKVLNRLRSLGGGKLYDSRYGFRQRGQGVYAKQLDGWFEVARRRAGLAERGPELSTRHFRVPGRAENLELFPDAANTA